MFFHHSEKGKANPFLVSVSHQRCFIQMRFLVAFIKDSVFQFTYARACMCIFDAGQKQDKN